MKKILFALMLLIPISLLLAASSLTPVGAKSAQLPAESRKAIGEQLLAGVVNIIEYNAGCCHEAAAFTLYMLGAKITPAELADKSCQEWVPKLYKEQSAGVKDLHKQWDGISDIPKGKAVGFYRSNPIAPNQYIFHSAVSTGGTKVRAANGGALGTSWAEVDLKGVLKTRNADGTFDYSDNNHVEKIRVLISDF